MWARAGLACSAVGRTAVVRRNRAANGGGRQGTRTEVVHARENITARLRTQSVSKRQRYIVFRVWSGSEPGSIVASSLGWSGLGFWFFERTSSSGMLGVLVSSAGAGPGDRAIALAAGLVVADYFGAAHRFRADLFFKWVAVLLQRLHLLTSRVVSEQTLFRSQGAWWDRRGWRGRRGSPRRAGRSPSSMTAAIANALGSSAETSNSRLCVTRVSPTALATPTPRPMPIGASACRTTIDSTSFELRAERHADTDLAALLRDRVRDDAVEPERGEQRGQRGEGADQPRRLLQARTG